MFPSERGLCSAAVVPGGSHPSSVLRGLLCTCSVPEPPGQGDTAHPGPDPWPMGSQGWEREAGQDWLLAECSLQGEGCSQLHLCLTSKMKYKTLNLCARVPRACTSTLLPSPGVKQGTHRHSSTVTASR